MIRIALPAFVVMATVATFVGVGTWNRSGPPRLAIVLTERELPMPFPSGVAPGEDPGLQLRIAVAHRADPLDAANWLPVLRLREIGFALDVPAGAPNAADVYANLPPREAWVVLEYDGPAWREIERRRALEPDRWPGYRAEGESRLVPVDAGRDFETLLRRYPTGHLIVPALIGVSYLPPAAGGPLVYGSLRQLTPSTLAVPAPLRGVFEGLAPVTEPAPPAGEAASVDMPPRRPRYDVEVAIGRLGLPYIRGARLR